MLYKEKSARKKLLRYSLLIPFILGLVVLFSSQTLISQDKSLDDSSAMITDSENLQKVFKVVDEMPRFPGCENSGLSGKELESCSNKKLFEFIGKNLRYPKAAKKDGVEGMVVVKFVVSEDGTIIKATVVKDIGSGCGEEALRVVRSMNDMKSKWLPGKNDGKNVSVELSLPFKYKLQDKDKIKSGSKNNEKSSSDKAAIDSKSNQTSVYKVVEEMPRFPGCEEQKMSLHEKNLCSNKKLMQFIMENLKYPEEAKKSGIEGMAVVEFVVDEDGAISNAKIIKDIGGGCGEESLRVVNAMNDMKKKWNPGKQKGKSVKVVYTLPFKFAL